MEFWKKLKFIALLFCLCAILGSLMFAIIEHETQLFGAEKACAPYTRVSGFFYNEKTYTVCLSDTGFSVKEVQNK